MKKRLLTGLLAAGLLAAGAAHAADEIVFVDFQEVFRKFYKTQLAQDQLRQQTTDIKVERDAMEEEIKKLKEEIEVLRADARDETLSEEVRQGKRDQLEEKLVELRKKEKEVREFEKLRMQQLEQQNKRMTRKLVDEINDAIVRYAKEKRYAAVIDRSAQSRSGIQMVLYTNVKLDITGEIIAILNEGREVGGTPATEKEKEEKKSSTEKKEAGKSGEGK